VHSIVTRKDQWFKIEETIGLRFVPLTGATHSNASNSE